VGSGYNPAVQPDYLYSGVTFCIDWFSWSVVDTLVDDAAQILNKNRPVIWMGQLQQKAPVELCYTHVFEKHLYTQVK
jgi:hypothetical protein